jgi:hypothetical protein
MQGYTGRLAVAVSHTWIGEFALVLPGLVISQTVVRTCLSKMFTTKLRNHLLQSLMTVGLQISQLQIVTMQSVLPMLFYGLLSVLLKETNWRLPKVMLTRSEGALLTKVVGLEVS